MSYEVIFTTKKKLNIPKILLVIAILIFVIVILAFTNYKINYSKVENEINQSINKFNDMESEREKAIKEQKQREENQARELKRYAPLSSNDIEKIDHIYSHSDQKRIFLTFDDGPTNQVTPYILDLLKNENIKANFFVLGQRAEQNPALVKREYEEGHFIGNHSFSHKYSSIYESIDSVFNEYNTTNDILKKATGNNNFNSLIFRFPGGAVGGPYNAIKQEASQKLKEAGISNVDWNALTGDAEGITTKEGLFSRFVETAQDKTSIVLLMHDASDKILTYETLPDIIKYCRDNGYAFQTIYDLLER